MQRPNDGLFYTRKGKPFTFSWREGNQQAYRLEPVTDLPGTLKVPAPADRKYTPASLPAVLIVVSERGGGTSHFFKWLFGAQSGSNRSTASAEKTRPAGWQRLSLHDAYRTLSDWIKNPERVQIVIDRTAGEEPNDEIRRAFAEIVSIVERSEWTETSSKLICATREVHKLKIDPLYSNLLSRGQACRLPHFSPPELVDWCAELDQKWKLGTTELDGLAKEVKRWVGGQVTLTQFFFRFVDDQLEKAPGSDVFELFQQAGKYLRAHRPHIVDRWALDLRDLLELPPVRRRMETYASGSTKDPLDPDFDDEDARLFLAGWVGLNPEKQWGIRSRCHMQWAREILRG
ncbi:MAG TPA: hypothetical protein VKM72_11790 [Thermoanaerobaculia bacterium]|nr:hypothetical protein [Thermoanaerobaculia bacterium]